MEAKIIEKKEHVLIIEPRDSMGRTRELAEQMARNDPKPIRLGETTRQVHAKAAENLSEFPKVLYEAAVNKNGIPVGDEVSPNAPLAFDLAASQGLDEVGFKIIGRKRQDGGHVVVRYPWRTHRVGVMLDAISCDIEASRAEERRLKARGCVDHPSKLRLPDTPLIRYFFDKSEPHEEMWSESQETKGARPTAARG